MLSSAHVLAMDAKNLLDVVDSLRKRFPELFPSAPTVALAAHSPAASATQRQPSPQPQPNRFQFDPHPSQTAPTSNVSAPPSTSDENYQIMTRQTYQNLTVQQQKQHLQQSHFTNNASDMDGGSASADNVGDDGGELYSNQAVIGAQHKTPTPIAAPTTANDAGIGIYDNEPQRQQHTLVDSISAVTTTVSPPKPPVAAKPSNLQQKLQKRQQQPLPREQLPLPDESQLNEPLRIVEDADAGSDGQQQLYGNSSVIGSVSAAAAAAAEAAKIAQRLPEPVPAGCSIVKESVFHKAMSNKLA